METSAALLTTKLHPPPLRPERVARLRLKSLLREGLSRPLTLVVAPAGFGKTTLLSAWCDVLRREDRVVAWLSLDPGDSDPTRFWAYVVAAVRQAHPGFGEQALALLRAPQPPPPHEALLPLLNELAELPGCLTLVLDDYHAIGGEHVHRGVAFLLERLPPNVQLVIDSRAEPPLPLARLRARDALVELRAEDLRFTVAEAGELLARVLGQDVTPEAAAALATRVEGWAAALHMAALAVRGRPDAARLAASFGGDHRFVLEYLVGEVLGRQPEYVQRFLLHTAVLDRMCAGLCDAVLAAGDDASDSSPSQWMLEELERLGLFLVPLDDERRWYRYHQLFGEALRARLRQTRPDLVPELHRRALAWHLPSAEGGDSLALAAAVGHALAAGATDEAAALVERAAGAALWQRGEVRTLEAWIAQLPEPAVASRPRLALARAWTRFLAGDIVGAADRLPGALLSPDADPAVRDEARLLAVIGSVMRGNLGALVELTAEPLRRPETPFLASIAALSRGVPATLAGDLSVASAAFAEAAELGRAARAPMVAIVALGQLGEIQLHQGRLRQAAETYRRAIAAAESSGLIGAGRYPPIVSQLHAGLGEILREWGELDAAERALAMGIERSGAEGVLWAFDGLISLAGVRRAQGAVAEAHAVLDRAEEHVQRLDVPLGLRIVAAHRVRLHLSQGELARAAQWVLPDRVPIAQLTDLEDLTAARLLLAQGWAGEALRLLRQVVPAARAGGRGRLAVEGCALTALAREALGERREACAALAETLALAAPEGYLRLFVDEGEPMRRLLTVCGGDAGVDDGLAAYRDRLLAAFPASAATQAAGSPAALPTAAVPQDQLGERELEILRLLAAGLANRAIAERLIIAESTVKWHLKSIYAKLDVASRTQAVARARELGLL